MGEKSEHAQIHIYTELKAESTHTEIKKKKEKEGESGLSIIEH